MEFEYGPLGINVKNALQSFSRTFSHWWRLQITEPKLQFWSRALSSLETGAHNLSRELGLLATKLAAKETTKARAKGLAKKIPLVSLGVGTAFGLWRYWFQMVTRVVQLAKLHPELQLVFQDLEL